MLGSGAKVAAILPISLSKRKLKKEKKRGGGGVGKKIRTKKKRQIISAPNLNSYFAPPPEYPGFALPKHGF